MDAEVLTLKGEKYALLPLAVWEKTLERLEELQDIADAKSIKAKIGSGEMETFPMSLVEDILNGKNPVKVYREYRKMTQAELAEQAGLSVEMIKKIEGGQSAGSVKSLRAIARSLNVDLDDLS